MRTNLTQTLPSKPAFAHLIPTATLGALVCFLLNLLPPPEARGQGTVVFNTRIASGNLQTTHIWGPSSTVPCLALIGLGSNDNPSGTTPFGSASAMRLIGDGGVAGGTAVGDGFSIMGYRTTFAQLIGAVGSNQPESALVPVGQTTTFRTGSALGDVASITDTLFAVPPYTTVIPSNCPAATFEIVAWDNSSGSYSTWATAFAAWMAGQIAAGHSAPFTVTNIGGGTNLTPQLNNTEPITSFNLHYYGEFTSWPIQPTNQTVAVGQGTAFWASALATPSGPRIYQWQFNGMDVFRELQQPGGVSSLIITNVQLTDQGSYRVVVSNLCGCSATSAVAVLTVVVPAPTITTQPTNRTIIAGQSATFYVDATGAAPLSYQWTFHGTNVAGATTNSLTTDLAGPYAVVVTNTYGSVTSAVATLTLLYPPTITTQPTNLTVLAGQSASLSVVATGSALLGYQWRFNGSDWLGATNSSLTLPDAQYTDQGSYCVVVTNSYGSVTSDVAILTVLSPPIIVHRPSSLAVTQGTDANFSVTASGTLPLSYQWQFEGTNLDGATGTSYTRSKTDCADAGTYEVVIANDYGSASSVAYLTVVSPPGIATQPQSLTVGNGEDATFSVIVTNLCTWNSWNNYQWRFNGTNLDGANNWKYTRYNVQSADAGSYDVVVTNLAGGATSAIAVLSMVVTPRHYVDLNNLSPTPPYTSWATAATNIQHAVDEAVDGDWVLVTNGVYQTGATMAGGLSNRVALTRAVRVQSVNGPEATIIRGYQVWGSTYGAAAVRCAYLTNGAVLAGFTLTNGATDNAIGPLNPPQSDGGGVWCESASAVVTNCVLAGNSAYDDGGGAYGGTLNNCVLTDNSAGAGGGASQSILNNCVLTANSATSGGGAYNSTLKNCTVAGNQVGTFLAYGGGVRGGTLTNCIVYCNTGGSSGSSNYYSSTLSYCCTRPLPSGTGNITNAPLFVNTNGWSNLRLQTNSPCINVGNNAFAVGLTDLDGNSRIRGGNVDMGAYEVQFLDAFHTWLGQYGLPTDDSADYADSDHDGMNNWQEWIAGTVPTNAASVLRIVSARREVSTVKITWTSVPQRTYTLERASHLGATPDFSVVKSNILGEPDLTTWTDEGAAGPGPLFYRVRVEKSSN
jgi:hypothetical protein